MLSLLIFFPLLGALAALAVRKAEAAKRSEAIIIIR
jgi:hypothetical protein